VASSHDKSEACFLNEGQSTHTQGTSSATGLNCHSLSATLTPTAKSVLCNVLLLTARSIGATSAAETLKASRLKVVVSCWTANQAEHQNRPALYSPFQGAHNCPLVRSLHPVVQRATPHTPRTATSSIETRPAAQSSLVNVRIGVEATHPPWNRAPRVIASSRDPPVTHSMTNTRHR